MLGSYKENELNNDSFYPSQLRSDELSNKKSNTKSQPIENLSHEQVLSLLNSFDNYNLGDFSLINALFKKLNILTRAQIKDRLKIANPYYNIKKLDKILEKRPVKRRKSKKGSKFGQKLGYSLTESFKFQFKSLLYLSNTTLEEFDKIIKKLISLNYSTGTPLVVLLASRYLGNIKNCEYIRVVDVVNYLNLTQGFYKVYHYLEEAGLVRIDKNTKHDKNSGLLIYLDPNIKLIQDLGSKYTAYRIDSKNRIQFLTDMNFLRSFKGFNQLFKHLNETLSASSLLNFEIKVKVVLNEIIRLNLKRDTSNEKKSDFITSKKINMIELLSKNVIIPKNEIKFLINLVDNLKILSSLIDTETGLSLYNNIHIIFKAKLVLRILRKEKKYHPKSITELNNIFSELLRGKINSSFINITIHDFEYELMNYPITISSSRIKKILSYIGDDKLIHYYVKKRKGFLHKDIDYIGKKLTNTILNKSRIHLLAQDIISCLLQMINELKLAKESNNEFISLYRSRDYEYFLTLLKLQSSVFKELNYILNEIALEVDVSFMKKGPIFKFDETTTKHLIDLSKIKVKSKNIHNIIIRDYLYVKNQLSEIDQLKMGIFTFPGCSISDLFSLAPSLGYENNGKFKSINSLLINFKDILKIYNAWTRTLSINPNDEFLNINNFLATFRRNKNLPKTTKFNYDILDSVDIQRFFQLFDALFLERFVNTANQLQSEELTIITNALISHIIGSSLIKFQNNGFGNLEGTINNLIVYLNHNRSNKGLSLFLNKLFSSNKCNLLRNRFTIGLESLLSPLSNHLYWDDKIGDLTNPAIYQDRARYLGVTNPVFICSRNSDTIKGLPDKLMKSIFSNNNYSVEHKVISFQNSGIYKQIDVREHQFLFLTERIVFDFSSETMLTKYLAWTIQLKIRYKFNVLQAIEYIKFVYNLFSNLVGYPKILHIDDAAKMPQVVENMEEIRSLTAITCSNQPYDG